jgi:hypothetical protein
MAPAAPACPADEGGPSLEQGEEQKFLALVKNDCYQRG